MEVRFKDGSTHEVDLNETSAIKAAIMVLFAPTAEDWVVLNALISNLERTVVEDYRESIVLEKYLARPEAIIHEQKPDPVEV